MGKIYTRSGDDGMTSTSDGGRVSKTDVRIDALGTLDELNVSVGIVRSFMNVDSDFQPLLKKVQLQNLP